ncbi:AraC family transcriptional regulator [Tumebacillus algifaecis]|nr:AraC family transcriptional regulator [Tumebacillus algifaecis]
MYVIDRMQKTINYIEEHMLSDIALTDLAEVAGYSAYHFHRLFQMTVGIAVMTYIKNRRLDFAANELIRTNRKILDIALAYGFGSHETFTRAFKRAYQITPGEYRKQGRYVQVFPRVDLEISSLHSTGGIQMTPTMLNKQEIKVLGYLVRIEQNDEQGNNIPAFWQRYIREGLGHTIPNPINTDVEYGVCVDYNSETGDCSYLIGMEVAEAPTLPEGSELAYRVIPAASYAVFTTAPVSDENFPETIQRTWGAIFDEWLPTSGYKVATTPDFELYDERCAIPDAKQMDIYLPIEKA